MRFVSFCLAVIAWMVAITGPTRAEQTMVLSVGGFERRVVLETPNVAGPRPLVLVLHGNAQRPEDVRARMNWQEWVAKDEIVVAFPEGVNLAWADGRAPEAFLGRKPVHGVDDVQFLLTLVDNLASQGLIDRKRVFVTGLSNGGLMTYRLLCERADVFAGGAAIAASLWPGLAKSCQPSQPRPLLVMNGTADSVIPFEPTDPNAIAKGAVYTVGTHETLAQWRRANGCKETMRVIPMPDVDANDRSTVTHIAWQCPPECAVELYRIEGGGHRIPALASTLQRLGVDLYFGGQNLDIDAAHEIWSFFSQVKTEAIAQRLGINVQ